MAVACGHHAPGGRHRAQDGPLGVDVHVVVHRLGPRVEDPTGLEHAGVVDEHVEVAAAIERGLPRHRIRHVEDHRGHALPPLALHRLFKRERVVVRRVDVVTAPGQRRDQRAADSACGSGDQDLRQGVHPFVKVSLRAPRR